MANSIPAGAEKDYYYDDYYDEDDDDDYVPYHPVQQKDQPKQQKRNCFIRFNDDTDGIIIIDDLRKSVESGNLDVFKSQIEKKPDLINTIFRSEWSCLMYAAFNGHHKIVKFCLENSADPNYVTHKDKQTALMICCSSDSNKDDVVLCTQHLINAGVDVNALDRFGSSALFFAVKKNNIKCIEELLKNNAQVNGTDTKSFTPLHWAASKGFDKVVLTLVNHKCDLKIKTWYGQTAADTALESGFEKLSEFLKKYENETTKDFKIADEDISILENVQNNSIISISEKLKEHKKKTKFQDHLDIFLQGLGMNEYAPIFKENAIDFNDLLILNDEDLVKMGITKYGHRKKILSAIHSTHTQNWEYESLMDLSSQTYLSCADMVNVVSNIAMHLTYIEQSIAFLHNKVKREPKCLEYSKETTNIQELYREAIEALKNTKSLSKKLKSFKVDIYKIKDERRFNPSDKIEANYDCWPDDNLSNHKLTKIGIAIIALTSGIFLLKYFRSLHFIRDSS